MEQEIFHNNIFKLHQFSLLKNWSKQGQQQRNKAFPPFISEKKITAFLQTTIQSTVKAFIFPKN